jgi:hypothetical protein
MSFFTIFGLTTLPGGISVLFLLLNRKNIGKVLMKYDKDYQPKYNINDILRLLKAYKKPNLLTVDERSLVVLAISCFLIGYITIIIWAILILFFPNIVLD